MGQRTTEHPSEAAARASVGELPQRWAIASQGVGEGSSPRHRAVFLERDETLRQSRGVTYTYGHGAAMTTGDAWIERVGGGARITLANGLGGPATGMFFLVRRLIDEGFAEGGYDEATAEAVVPGRAIRDYLASITDLRSGQSLQVDGVPQEDGRAVSATIAPDDDYSVSYVEV